MTVRESGRRESLKMPQGYARSFAFRTARRAADHHPPDLLRPDVARILPDFPVSLLFTGHMPSLHHLPVGLPGDAGCATISETVLIALPASLAATSLYVVGAAGDTFFLPESGTLPIPWPIVTDVAFVTFHERTAVAPGSIETGDTENTIAGNLALSGTGIVISGVSGWEDAGALAGAGAGIELELLPAHDPNTVGNETSNKIKM